MKLKSLVLLIGALTSAMAMAEGDCLLYWMLDTEGNPDYQFVQMSKTGGDVIWFTDANGDRLDDVATLTGDSGVDHFYSDFSGYGEGDSFLLEIMNDQGTTGGSYSVPYADLIGFLYSPSSGEAPATYAGWRIYAVPEPTSGLMLLLGTALLALRRKRA